MQFFGAVLAGPRPPRERRAVLNGLLDGVVGLSPDAREREQVHRAVRQDHGAGRRAIPDQHVPPDIPDSEFSQDPAQVLQHPLDGLDAVLDLFVHADLWCEAIVVRHDVPATPAQTGLHPRQRRKVVPPDPGAAVRVHGEGGGRMFQRAKCVR